MQSIRSTVYKFTIILNVTEIHKPAQTVFQAFISCVHFRMILASLVFPNRLIHVLTESNIYNH